MKLRIVHKGNGYLVQKKFLFWWQNCFMDYCFGDFIHVVFETKEQAFAELEKFKKNLKEEKIFEVIHEEAIK